VFILLITVRLFASYREKTNLSQIDLDLPIGSTVGNLAKEVVVMLPMVIGDPSKLVIAINDEFQYHDFLLKEGDEAALIPPVSGGTN